MFENKEIPQESSEDLKRKELQERLAVINYYLRLNSDPLSADERKAYENEELKINEELNPTQNENIANEIPRELYEAFRFYTKNGSTFRLEQFIDKEGKQLNPYHLDKFMVRQLETQVSKQLNVFLRGMITEEKLLTMLNLFKNAGLLTEDLLQQEIGTYTHRDEDNQRMASERFSEIKEKIKEKLGFNIVVNP